ncbi:MAG TPA: cytidine deaminase [Candidatus Bathyarchaeota archaeon]|nr:cytidine deaminase [Candidatus Bathyarchaeota archaeon]
MEEPRPSFDEYFMRICHVVKTRSTCLRRKVGAILVKDRRILATGYNGAPKGLPHCAVTGCLRQKLNVPPGERHELCRGLHAEQNALLQAAVFGVSTRGATLYCTTFPCTICAKMLINAEIKEVVYDSDYEDPLSKELLRQAGIKVRRVHVDEPVWGGVSEAEARAGRRSLPSTG